MLKVTTSNCRPTRYRIGESITLRGCDTNHFQFTMCLPRCYSVLSSVMRHHLLLYGCGMMMYESAYLKARSGIWIATQYRVFIFLFEFTPHGLDLYKATTPFKICKPNHGSPLKSLLDTKLEFATESMLVKLKEFEAEGYNAKCLLSSPAWELVLSISAIFDICQHCINTDFSIESRDHTIENTLKLLLGTE